MKDALIKNIFNSVIKADMINLLKILRVAIICVVLEKYFNLILKIDILITVEYRYLMMFFISLVLFITIDSGFRVLLSNLSRRIKKGKDTKKIVINAFYNQLSGLHFKSLKDDKYSSDKIVNELFNLPYNLSSFLLLCLILFNNEYLLIIGCVISLALYFMASRTIQRISEAQKLYQGELKQ